MTGMVVGKNTGKIVDYGMSKTKLGSPQVFVKILLNGCDEQTWYGVLVKKDGQPNEFVLGQLAYCGFDFGSMSLDQLALGTVSNALDIETELDVYCKMMVGPDGSEKLRIDTIGSVGPSRIDGNELNQLITPEQKNMFSALASKFKPRPKKKKEDPIEEIPF